MRFGEPTGGVGLGERRGYAPKLRGKLRAGEATLFTDAGHEASVGGLGRPRGTPGGARTETPLSVG